MLFPLEFTDRLVNLPTDTSELVSVSSITCTFRYLVGWPVRRGMNQNKRKCLCRKVDMSVLGHREGSEKLYIYEELEEEINKASWDVWHWNLAGGSEFQRPRRMIPAGLYLPCRVWSYVTEPDKVSAQPCRLITCNPAGLIIHPNQVIIQPCRVTIQPCRVITCDPAGWSCTVRQDVHPTLQGSHVQPCRVMILPCRVVMCKFAGSLACLTVTSLQRNFYPSWFIYKVWNQVWTQIQYHSRIQYARGVHLKAML